MVHGREVWDGPLGSIARDWVRLRDLVRRGRGDDLFCSVVGIDDLRELLNAALARGDEDAAGRYAVAIHARDPERFRRALLGLLDEDEENSSDSPPEPDPPVTQAPSPTEAKGPKSQP